MKTGFFEEAPGVRSMARLILFLAFVVCVVLPVLAWVALAFTRKEALTEFGPLFTFCGAAFASAAAGKTTQAIFGEKTNP